MRVLDRHQIVLLQLQKLKSLLRKFSQLIKCVVSEASRAVITVTQWRDLLESVVIQGFSADQALEITFVMNRHSRHSMLDVYGSSKN